MKLSKLKLSVLLGVVAVLAIFVSIQMVKADTGSNTYGYLWSSNIGWIKLNDCSNPGTNTGCSSTGGYGVNISPTTGVMSGYAWSSNIGWITFNSAGCPTNGCTPGAKAVPQSGGTYSIVGWARACSVYASGCSGALNSTAILGTCDADASGDVEPDCHWDGYIALDSKTAGGSGGTWGLSIGSNRTIGGFAWGSNVIGWIKSITGAVTDANGPQVTLVANPTTITKGDTSTLTVTASNIDGPNACSFAGLASGLTMKQQTDGSWLGTLVVSPTLTTTYTVNCTKGAETASASATVTVIYIVTPPCVPGTTNCPGNGGNPGGSGGTNGSGGGNYCTNTSPSFAWDSDATSCTISEAGGGTVNVSGSSKAQGGTQLPGDTNGPYYYTPNLPVSGTSTVYTFQCSDGSKPIKIPVTVNSCQKDFAVTATGAAASQCSPVGTAVACQDLVTSEDGKTMSATFNVNIVPSSYGFVDPVTLSLGSWSTKALVTPDSSIFNPTVLSYNGTKYGTSQLTISIPVTKDLKLGDVFTASVYGTSDGLPRFTTINVTVGGSITIDPIYKEF